MRNLLLLFLGCICWLGCNVINPKEQVPTFLKIDSVAFSDGSHRITSVWVYYNNATVGVFKLPASIPVLASKAGTIAIGPGVEINGLQDQQSVYPFYAFDTFTITPAPGQVIPYTPTTHYTTVAKFPWKEDFESGSDFQAYDTSVANGVVTTVTDPNLVFEGHSSGYMHVTSADTMIEVVANQHVSIPQGQSYLEFDYRCNTSFQVGVVAVDPLNGRTKDYLTGIRPHETWNKFYVDLQSAAGQFASGYSLFIIVRATLDAGQTDGYVFLDNMKVVSY